MTNVFDYQAFSLPNPQQENDRLRAALRRAEDEWKKLTDVPLGIVTVIAITGPRHGVVSANPPMEVSLPEGAKVGSQVRVAATNNGVTLLEAPIAFGPVAEVVRIVGRFAVVKTPQTEAFLALADGLEVAPGDRVALDPTSAVILLKLPTARDGAHAAPAQSVTWDDIGGQEEAKEALREAIEYPVRYAEIYKAHGQKPAKGAMLYGPAGTGKTMLGRSLAASIGSASGFFYVKATEVMGKWQGESGQRVRDLFRRGREHQAATGKRAVLFIDEADALLPVREGGGVKVSGSVEDMVPVFLAEMDGLDELGPFVLLATNRPDRIDPAILRDGRCEAKVKVGRPDKASAEAIFRLALRGRSVPDYSLEGLAGSAADELFSDRHQLLELAYPDVRQLEYIRLRDLVSGAMIEGIVQRAAGLAIKRDRERGEVGQLFLGDLEQAIKLTLRQQARVNHNEVIAELSARYGKAPEKVRKVVDG